MSEHHYKPLPAGFHRGMGKGFERRLKGGAHSYMLLSEHLAIAFRSSPAASFDSSLALEFLKEQYRQLGVIIDALEDAAEKSA